MNKKEKILIIKTGYSEILDKEENSKKVSFGDVLRTTPLLHLYKKDHVTWITDESALPLLEGNPYIDRILPLDFWAAAKLQEEEFDSLINLEKNLEICKFSNKIEAWRKYGFRFDRTTNSAQAYDRAFEVLGVTFDPRAKKENQRTVEDLLFEMVGKKWNGEGPILGYQSKTTETHDIALNTFVGEKWPSKKWPPKKWDKLEKLLKNKGFKVTRQDKQNKNILTNLYDYIDWLNSSRIIVSNDSLGMHLGFALKKKVIGLFGPTPHKEVFFYDSSKVILPEKNYDCLPCFKGKCDREEYCMDDISVKRVFNTVKDFFH